MSREYVSNKNNTKFFMTKIKQMLLEMKLKDFDDLTPGIGILVMVTMRL